MRGIYKFISFFILKMSKFSSGIFHGFLIFFLPWNFFILVSCLFIVILRFDRSLASNQKPIFVPNLMRGFEVRVGGWGLTKN